MLTLSLPKDPYWLPIAGELAFKVRPLTTAIWSTAQARVRQEIRVRIDLQKTMADANIKPSTANGEYLPDYADPAVLEGEGEALFCRFLAQIGIIEWKGVYDHEGEPVAFDPENAEDYIATIMDQHPDVAKLFLVDYVSGRLALEDEKKNYAPGPNGTTPLSADPDTAKSASAPAVPAPPASEGTTASAVRTSKTSPKPRKAGKSGT